MKKAAYLVFWSIFIAGLLTLGLLGSNTPSCEIAPLQYLANSTQNIVQETPLAAPASNTPFVDPDFGSRMVRATDGNTLAGVWNNHFLNVSFLTDASSEANIWSAFDPTLGTRGGYYFLIGTRTGWYVMMKLDAATMQVSRLTGLSVSNVITTDGVMYVGGTFSFVDPKTFYFMQSRQLSALNLGTGAVTPIYNFNSCSNLPSDAAGSYSGGLTNSADDNRFSYYFGGSAQGATAIVATYDRVSGSCYWYDSTTGTIGGTNLSPTPVASGVGQLPTPSSPSVTVQPGNGTLPAGSYYVEITAVTLMNPKNGETLPSKEVGPITLSSPGSLVVSLPTTLSDPYELEIPNGSWGGVPGSNGSTSGLKPFNVYIGTASGAETLQNTSPVGGTYVQSAPLNTTSAPLPTVSTAGYNVHNARLTKDGNTVRVDAQEGYTLFFWNAETNQVGYCTLQLDDCGGHQTLGSSRLVNDPNDYDMADVLLRPVWDLHHYTRLVSPLPTPHQFTDSHWSWNDADPNDVMPVCGSIDYAGSSIVRAYSGEIDCVSTVGPTRVWRFAHHRATGLWNQGPGAPSNFWATPRGNVSQDGHFYIFTSDWEGGLGNEPGSTGCPTSGYCRTDVFIVELK